MNFSLLLLKISLCLVGSLYAQSPEEIQRALAKKAMDDRIYLESSEDQSDDQYSDYFESDDWNDYAGLWIDSNDYLENDEDYVINREYAHQKQLEDIGYVRDPRQPHQPPIKLFPDDGYRVEHIVKTPPMPPGFAYSIRHCVAQSEAGPIYKLIFNKCLDKKLDVQRHAPGIAFGESRISFRKFRFLGIPGGFDQNIRYACKISLCDTRVFGSCRASNHNCPNQDVPDLPATGVAERKRFFEPGYRGLGAPHMRPEKAFQPFGGFVDIQKTASSGAAISLKSSEDVDELERSEKHGYNMHVGDFIYKKLNETVSINGTETVIETLEKVRPMSGEEIKLGLARHLFQTGVKIKELIRMKLLERPERLVDQDDFEAMAMYHEHSMKRHQRRSETKKEFRRRIRKIIKQERSKDPNYVTPKEQRRRDRVELRALLKNDLILEQKNQIDDPDYEDEP